MSVGACGLLFLVTKSSLHAGVWIWPVFFTSACARHPRPIMMPPVAVISVDYLWSSLTTSAITNCFAGNGHCTRHCPVQNEQNLIFKSIFIPFCTELYYPRVKYCSTDGKVSIQRAREVGVVLPKNVPKSKLEVNKIYQEQGYELHHIITTKQYRV